MSSELYNMMSSGISAVRLLSGRRHPETMETIEAYAELLKALGRPEEAASLKRQK